MTKEQVLLYLRRILKDYEPNPPDPATVLVYERRLEKENPEAAALHAAIELVEKFYHVKY